MTLSIMHHFQNTFAKQMSIDRKFVEFSASKNGNFEKKGAWGWIESVSKNMVRNM